MSHPGGRADEKFPVNANEAESRRLARFSPMGHTPGPIAMPAEERNPEFPLTLDLRWPAEKTERQAPGKTGVLLSSKASRF